MTKFYPVIFFLLITCSVAAQQPWPRTFGLNKDSLPAIKLDHRYWQLLADSSGHLSLGQVQKLPFRPAGSDSLELRNTDGKQIYWLRYQIKNTLPGPVRLVWSRPMSRADIFVIDSAGRRIFKTTGSSIPWSIMPDQKQFNEISVRIGGGETAQIYERQEFYPEFNDLVVSASFRVGNDSSRRLEDYYENQLSTGTYQAFEAGFMLLAAIITLFFYIVSREKLYLYFSLFGIAYSGVALCLVVFNAFFREYPQIQQASRLLYTACLFCLWHFLALFYRLPACYPRWYRINTVASWIFLPLGLLWYCPFIPAAIAVIFLRTMTVVFLASGSLSLFWGIFRKGEGRRKRLLTALPFLAMGLSYLIFAALLSSLHASEALKKQLDDWAGTVLSLCFFWMTGSFLWSLIERFQHLQKQVLQETLARERMARENEQHRLALMAAQQAELEKQVDERTAELKRSLANLKLTQNQLIQSEKMASLGELTAGIAHEIQNPLNFVNNFSEVSVELLAELKEEATAGRTGDVLDIADDLAQNLEKIHNHGKRADNIVKGMLEHSRTGSGVKEPTDLNKLAEEYFKLAYHGLRSRDKSFNAELISRYGENLPLVNVVPQDIGRVLLNLFNNAFYAVQLRKQTAGPDYQPQVEIHTFAPAPGGWGATIRDNGTGIPENIKSKIMQPFFTTKPTGEGTGLGLSLSYDILVKGHNGCIELQSAVGEGAVFTITLP